ncbi:hypothetical protein LCM02_09170 [Lutimonas saemankumensis]|uniref:hypothetical protein n=1 Tax=Lutimonas saemankumensis TaxID=483016 RepID=UPI001CD6A58E|nr:hypothetical protein [Lutimonas saemankumensis]MCA0932620.1 hypothetical protein [Lutimonas saemankumensis]
MKTIKITLFVFFLVSPMVLSGQENKSDSLKTEVSMDELNRQLENPLSRFWSLIFQENLAFNGGELVQGTEFSNVFNFQPSLPVPVGKSKMLLVRPVFPLVSAPRFNEQGEKTGMETGLGDINVFSLYGPDKKDGLIWGVGMTFTFPTATSNYLGSGKTQLGPALMALSITKKWTLGTIVQHWNSVGGDVNRSDVTKTDIQYIARKQIPGKGMSIGMGPNIGIDWNAPSGNKLTLPIGLGITKTVKWGNTPMKLRFEPQYSIVKPDNYGTLWNVRIQIAPIVQNPFLKK